MAGNRKKNRIKRQLSDINMTPMMDLTFILLITFIITFPLLEQGISIRLPKANAAKLKASQSQTVTVDASGSLYLNRQELTLAELERQLKSLASQNSELMVMVRGDESLVYGRIIMVLKTLHSAGITRTSLVTQQE